jgi:hypothetical protein
MAEPVHRAESVRAGAPLRAGAVTLLPVERTVVHAVRVARGAWLSATREPYALVVREAGGLRVVAAGPAPVSLEELRERIPGLEALLPAP